MKSCTLSFLIVSALNCASSNAVKLTGNADYIKVIKSKRILEVYSKKIIVKKYPISLGLDPIGAKNGKGDCKTPEGLYYIKGKGPSSIYNKYLLISYPNKTDIASSEKSGVDPGDDIEIHGFPVEFKNKENEMIKSDWTHGCIALKNRDIDELYFHVPLNTIIEIVP